MAGTIRVDLPGVRRICTLLAICAASLRGQGFDSLNRVLQKELDKNAKTVTVDPGRSGHLRLSLRPQTIGSDTIFVATDNQSVRVALRLPNGTLVNDASANAAGFGWKVEAALDGFEMSACKSAKSWVTIGLPQNQPVGDYTIEIQPPQGAQRTTACATFLSLGLGREGVDYETVGDSVKADRQFYQLGDLVTISVPVLEGTQPVPNARVEAVVSYQDNVIVKDEVTRLILTDRSGTGTYTGLFRPEKASQYQVTVTITGRKRREVGSFFVVPLNGRLLSATLASPSAEHSQARMLFDIFAAGEYTITPTLRSKNGKTDNAFIRVDLTPGQHVVTWEIREQDLQALEMEPPYELVQVHVLRKNAKATFGDDLVGTWDYQDGYWKPK